MKLCFILLFRLIKVALSLRKILKKLEWEIKFAGQIIVAAWFACASTAEQTYMSIIIPKDVPGGLRLCSAQFRKSTTF